MHCYTRFTQIKNRCIMGGKGRGVFSDFRMGRVRICALLEEGTHADLMLVPISIKCARRKSTRCKEGKLVVGMGTRGWRLDVLRQETCILGKQLALGGVGNGCMYRCSNTHVFPHLIFGKSRPTLHRAFSRCGLHLSLFSSAYRSPIVQTVVLSPTKNYTPTKNHPLTSLHRSLPTKRHGSQWCR